MVDTELPYEITIFQYNFQYIGYLQDVKFFYKAFPVLPALLYAATTTATTATTTTTTTTTVAAAAATITTSFFEDF